MSRSSRRHLAARVEDRIDRALARWLTRRGWRPFVSAAPGYADGDGVHVFIRVLLGPPAMARSHRAARGWRSFLVVPAAGTEVTVHVGGHSDTLTSLRDGYVHVELPVVLAAGWHELTVEVRGREPVTAQVKAVDRAARHGVISDIDDTILVTWVPQPLLAAWNTFVLHEHARRPVDGMAGLIHSLAADDGPVVYLSTGSWNVASHLERFMSEHGYPPGPMLLTDWGPTDTGWFRHGPSHKREMLERLHREHPAIRWTLLGDDGQRDPEIYAEFANAHPDAVRAIAIRHLSFGRRVVARARSARRPRDASTPANESPPAEVVWVTGTDGHELQAALIAHGVVPPA